MSQRAGLVMNPDAKVKLLGVPVGRVGSIEERPDGRAAIHLEMDPGQLAQIPDNVVVDISSPTVFGAKSVDLVPPQNPSPRTLQPGQVLDSDHVTVEFNTIFEQLILGAVQDSAGEAQRDTRRHRLRVRRSRAAVRRDAEPARPVPREDRTQPAESEPRPRGRAPGAQRLRRRRTGPGPDRRNATSISQTVVDEQQNLDAFLVSTIGLADIGNDVLGSNGAG